MLRKINTEKYHSDKGQAQRTAREQLKFIQSNLKAFESVASQKNIEAFNSFAKQFFKKVAFSDNQLSYIDVLYEKTMEGLGLPSYSGIKYGKHVRLK